MADDIYAPPKADPVMESEAQARVGFYQVSALKFWLLFLFTLGAYQVYWFYRHWKAQKQLNPEPIWPVARGIFSIFFVHSLFQRIHVLNPPGSRALSGLATLFVILTIGGRILSRLSGKDIGSPWTDLAGLAALPLAGYCLAVAQKQANIACGDPLGSANSRFTAANILWMLLGTAVWLLAILGLMATFGWIALEE